MTSSFASAWNSDETDFDKGHRLVLWKYYNGHCRHANASCLGGVNPEQICSPLDNTLTEKEQRQPSTNVCTESVQLLVASVVFTLPVFGCLSAKNDQFPDGTKIVDAHFMGQNVDIIMLFPITDSTKRDNKYT